MQNSTFSVFPLLHLNTREVERILKSYKSLNFGDMSRNAGSGENGDFGEISPSNRFVDQIIRAKKFIQLEGPRNVREFGKCGESGESGNSDEISPRSLTKFRQGL